MSQTTALLLTLLIEIPIAVGICKMGRWAPGELWQVALVSVGASLLTHPLLWMAADLVRTLPSLLLAETGIALLEGVVYAWAAGLGLWRGQLVSLLANGASLGVGLALSGLS
jgi:hypothetical protein